MGPGDISSGARRYLPKSWRPAVGRSGGGTLGVLSGGCLEEEIGRHGRNVLRDSSPLLLSFDTRRLYGCDGRLKILVEPLPPAGENGNLITNIGRLMKNRAVCRVRTCFEGDTLGSDLLAADLFLAEQRGVFIETLQLPVRLLLFGTGPEIEPITQLADSSWLDSRTFRPPIRTAAKFSERHTNRRGGDESQLRS